MFPVICAKTMPGRPYQKYPINSASYKHEWGHHLPGICKYLPLFGKKIPLSGKEFPSAL
jgi:hypothetical protein